MSTMYDIIIVGGGIVGAATALALARETALSVAVVEANIPPDYQRTAHYDHRVSAISPASKAILQNLDCWDMIKATRLSAYHQMHVWDANSAGTIHFDSHSVGESVLGYIIEDSVIRASLHQQIRLCPSIDFLCPATILNMNEKANHIELIMQDHAVLTTKLLIGADGAESCVRTQATMALKNVDYGQTAMVATVTTTLPHQSTAWQRFLSSGPLAFLPLDDPYRCSIVWSAAHDDASQLQALDDISFCERIGSEFAHKLGDITQVTSRYSFPLRMRHVEQYVRSHLALIGDAAHTIHPLAGQGVNLGLLDAAALSEVIVDAYQKNRDYSSLATLRRYERWRKGDTVSMLALVAGLKRLFGSERASIQKIRGMGLAFVNDMPIIKTAFINYALGRREDLPKLCGYIGVIA